MYEVTMPKLSDSMTSGQIVAWRVKEGDAVSEGDVLAEIESDKATLELECFRAGTVAKLLRAQGEEVPCGEVIATIADEADATAAPQQAPQPPTEKPRPASAPPAPPPPVEWSRPPSAPPVPRDLRHIKAPGTLKTPGTITKPAGRVAISPYARALAQQKGVDYTRLTGSGPGGRIIARDVEAAVRSAGFSPYPDRLKAEPQAPAIPPSPDEELPPIVVTPDEAEVEEAPYRLKTQARIVTASKHVIPHFYMTRGADVTALLARKDELKARFGGATVTHVLMLAAIRAIKANPLVNRSYDRGKIIKWKAINLGLAVDTEQGLTVAVLRGAQDLSLRELVERSKPLVEKARGGKLSAEERRHPTFTITNLGMFDVEQFEPIINPPSAITLGVASALPTAVVRGQAIHIATVMRLTVSCDHRIIEGVTAARFLKSLKDLLEAPDALLADH